MTRRAARHGEVQHLRGEDEGGGQAEERHATRRQRRTRLPERHRYTRHGEGGRRHYGLGIEEPVGNMHGAA